MPGKINWNTMSDETLERMAHVKQVSLDLYEKGKYDYLAPEQRKDVLNRSSDVVEIVQILQARRTR